MPIGTALFPKDVAIYERTDVLYQGTPCSISLASVTIPSRGVYVSLTHSGLSGCTVTVSGSGVSGATSEVFSLTSLAREQGSTEFTGVSSISVSGPGAGGTITANLTSRSGDPVQVLRLLTTTKGNLIPRAMSAYRATEGVAVNSSGFLATCPAFLLPGYIAEVDSRKYEIKTADPVIQYLAGLTHHMQCSVEEWRGDE